MIKIDGPGYVYIMSNNSVSYLKIGSSKNPPFVRATQLSRYMPFSYPFVLEWAGRVKNRLTVEKELHKMLKPQSVGREFFDIDKETVIEILKDKFKAIDRMQFMKNLLEGRPE
jgi:hypothetical protein